MTYNFLIKIELEDGFRPSIVESMVREALENIDCNPMATGAKVPPVSVEIKQTKK